MSCGRASSERVTKNRLNGTVCLSFVLSCQKSCAAFRQFAVHNSLPTPKVGKKQNARRTLPIPLQIERNIAENPGNTLPEVSAES